MSPPVKTIPFSRAIRELDLPGLDRNLFSSLDWMTVLEKTYKLKLCIKYILDQGCIRSYIIYSVVRNFLEWKICICSYCDYCDCQVGSKEDWDLFLNALKEEYPEYRIAIRNLRDPFVRETEILKVLYKERLHVLDLHPETHDLWRGTTDSFRSAVNQARRKGVVVKVCEKKNLKDFYRLHLRVRKNKYKVFPQPFRFFERIWDQYMEKDSGVLFGAFDSAGSFIGGNIFLVCGDTLYYKFNTSDVNYLHLRPNNILFWSGIEYAKTRNLKYIDLGSSGIEQKGLILFKNQTGAQMLDIVHLGYHPQNYKFSQKRILKTFTKVCTLPFMPDCLVKWGSHIIYPFLA